MTHTSSRRQVISALTGLSAEERAEVVRWAEALGVQSLTRQDNEAAEHAFTEVSSLLASHYRMPPQSLTTFARTRTAEYRRFLRAVARVNEAIGSWWPGQRRTVQLALLRFLCRVAFEVCVRRTSRVGWLQITNALAEIEATVNVAFPGWLRTGMFQARTLQRVTGRLDAWHESVTFTEPTP